MVYSISTEPLPSVHEIYFIRRKTVWSQVYEDHVCVIIANGNCIFKTDNVVYDMREGTMLFVPAGKKITRMPVNDTECDLFYLHFSVASFKTHDSNNFDAIQNQIKTKAEYMPTDRSDSLNINKLQETPLFSGSHGKIIGIFFSTFRLSTGDLEGNISNQYY